MFKVLKSGPKALCLRSTIIIERASTDLSLVIIQNLGLVRTN
jgi:hypothetical protein